MRFPKYIMATDPLQQPEQEMILCTEKPYYVAGVMKFKQDWKALQFDNNSSHLLKVRVPGYDIFLYFTGSIEGSRVEITPDYEIKVAKILKEMVYYYVQARITTNPFQFSKYKTFNKYKTDKDA